MSLFCTPVGGVEPRVVAERVTAWAAEGRRLDQRGVEAFRELRVQVKHMPLPVLTLAVGGSCVTVGVKAELAPCDPALPHHGRVAVDCMAPLVGSSVPSDALLTSRRAIAVFVEETIAQVLDAASLCIRPAEACWLVHVDVLVLSIDGGLRDLAAVGACAALHHMALPPTALPDGSTAPAMRPRLRAFPSVRTFALVGAVLLADPLMSEEQAASAIVTVVVDAARPQAVLRVTHFGGGPVTPKVLALAGAAMAGPAAGHYQPS